MWSNMMLVTCISEHDSLDTFDHRTYVQPIIINSQVTKGVCCSKRINNKSIESYIAEFQQCTE